MRIPPTPARPAGHSSARTVARSGVRRSPFTFHVSRLSHAFTLIEILIAMTILSVVLAAIYSTWTAILRASKVGLDAAAAVQRARIASRTIEECLGSVQSYAANLPYYGFVSENGSEAMLSFVTRLGPSFPRSGKFGDLDVRRVTFTLEPGRDNNRQLVLRQQPLLMEMDVDEKNYPLVLAKNVKEFKTEFWDMRLHDWLDEWKQTNALPTLVKVTLKLADNQFSSQVREQVTRFVSLPAVTVQPVWQKPRLGAVPGGGATPLPGQPGGPGVPGSPGFIQNPIAPGGPGFPGNQNIPGNQTFQSR